MEKTKLGISVGIFGAAVYFMGIINYIPLVILAGYILLMEENKWLRKAAVKAVAIIMIAALVPALLGMLSYVFDFVNIIIGWVRIDFKFGYPLNINGLINTVVYFVRDGLLLACGYCALSLGTVKVGFIDKLIDKNI